MSFDQRENLREAILKKKARIAELERTLNRPPLTEYRGHPVHLGKNSRLRLEEERQHLLLAVSELERQLVGLDLTSRHIRESVQTPFDSQLCDLNLTPAINQLHEEAGQCWARARAEVKELGNSARLYPAFVEYRLEVLRKHLEEVDRIMREVRLLDGNVTPEFIRRVLVPRVFSTIAEQKDAIQHEMEQTARRRGEHNSGVLHYLIQEISHLQSELAARYEAEALECVKRAARDRMPEPVRPISTGLTRAGAPPSEPPGLGRGLALPEPKPTSVPHDPPRYFPADLWPETNVILLKAQRKFSLQTQTVEMCKHIVSELTPVFVEAVRTGKIRATSVQMERGGGMEDLLHHLLVCNDPGQSVSGISNEAYRLGQQIRKSDEWLRLSEAIAEAQHLRTGATQAPSPAENRDKTAQSAESKGAEVVDAKTRIGQNIDRLRKECGWSHEALADATGIDKKLVLAHVHRKHKPNPKTLREYAQAFSKELNRSITPNNLDE